MTNKLFHTVFTSKVLKFITDIIDKPNNVWSMKSNRVDCFSCMCFNIVMDNNYIATFVKVCVISSVSIDDIAIIAVLDCFIHLSIRITFVLGQIVSSAFFTALILFCLKYRVVFFFKQKTKYWIASNFTYNCIVFPNL